MLVPPPFLRLQMGLWQKVEAGLADNGPLTDRRITQRALEGWYGPTVKLRYQLAEQKRDRRMRSRLKQVNKLDRLLEGLI